jgi:hypothetical protein
MYVLSHCVSSLDYSDFVLQYDGAPGVLMGDFNGEVSTSDFERKLPEAAASEHQARAAVVPDEPLPVTVPLLQDGLVDLWTTTPLRARFVGYPHAVPEAAGATAHSLGDVSAGLIRMSEPVPVMAVTVPPLPDGGAQVSAPPLPPPATAVLRDHGPVLLVHEQARPAADQTMPPQMDIEALERGWTFHSWGPRSRIDYVFVRRAGGLKAREMRLVGVTNVTAASVGLRGDESSGGANLDGVMFPSDHRFVLAVLVRDDTHHP